MSNDKSNIKWNIDLGGVTIIFIILKLTGVVNWNWTWVLAPLWISVTFLILGIVFVATCSKLIKKCK